VLLVVQQHYQLWLAVAQLQHQPALACVQQPAAAAAAVVPGLRQQQLQQLLLQPGRHWLLLLLTLDLAVQLVLHLVRLAAAVRLQALAAAAAAGAAAVLDVPSANQHLAALRQLDPLLLHHQLHELLQPRLLPRHAAVAAASAAAAAAAATARLQDPAAAHLLEQTSGLQGAVAGLLLQQLLQALHLTQSQQAQQQILRVLLQR
jgi:hypothetical protein